MDWLNNLTAGLVSGGIVSLFFYLLSGRQLAREAARLRQLTTLIIRGMEEAKFVRFNRDAAGEPIGVIFERNIVDIMGIATGLQATATVTKKGPNEPA